MEMAPEEAEYVMQQAVLSQDDIKLSGFVTMFDESGKLRRRFDDGHRK